LNIPNLRRVLIWCIRDDGDARLPLLRSPEQQYTSEAKYGQPLWLAQGRRQGRPQRAVVLGAMEC